MELMTLPFLLRLEDFFLDFLRLVPPGGLTKLFINIFFPMIPFCKLAKPITTTTQLSTKRDAFYQQLSRFTRTFFSRFLCPLS